jgi:hypothetical protein
MFVLSTNDCAKNVCAPFQNKKKSLLTISLPEVSIVISSWVAIMLALRLKINKLSHKIFWCHLLDIHESITILTFFFLLSY